jgi:aspartyl-tRNA(Asn)/glutamyl-tRNA(Gln) amidotransferase subunit B
MSKYELVCGIEAHVQLKTKTKMFCSCALDMDEKQTNVNICPVCLGLPGTLPRPNKKAFELSLVLAKGLQAKINYHTRFDRKNYFYPDLPKGYQITQNDYPIVFDGRLPIYIDGKWKEIGIERAHLEEDAAKSHHPEGAEYTLIDYNRGGSPLLEIVSRPEIRSSLEARLYLQELYYTVMNLGISDADMEKGQFKFDVNVSLRPVGSQDFGSKVELKNLNSFRFAQKALDYEFKRQSDLLDKGEYIPQETRGYDQAKDITFSQRSKELAQDYRYFPEPDIPPFNLWQVFAKELETDLDPKILPKTQREILIIGGLEEKLHDLFLGNSEAMNLLIDSLDILGQDHFSKITNWLIGDYQNILNEGDIESKLTAKNLSELITLTVDGTISSKIAKDIFPDIVRGESPVSIIQARGLRQDSDPEEIRKIIQIVLDRNPSVVEQYKGGNGKVLGFLVGMVIKESQGKANPAIVNKLLLEMMSK